MLNYEYNQTAYLGKVRYIFYKNSASNSLEHLQSDEYHPFGLRKSRSLVSLNNKYPTERDLVRTRAI